MSDDPVPRNLMGQKYIRKIVTKNLLDAVMAAGAQKQYVLCNKSDDDPKMVIVAEMADVGILALGKGKTVLYKGLIPHFRQILSSMLCTENIFGAGVVYYQNFTDNHTNTCLRAWQDFICG